ncbi:MAG: MFS transporter [Actinobacteria bacterium]|nr:MFS transporter [Actinomycetota bacterium]
MLPLNALGFLTVVAYGTWFYGFGVLFSTLSSFHNVSASTLGVTYGIANLISGAGAIATGRRLDVFGPRAVLGVIGPLGAIIYGASSFASGTTFLATYALGGGLIGAAGFYSFTQPLAVRVAKTDAARAITRLTIWGAFSSPIMIPFTEILRANFGWQTAVRLTAVLTAISFLAAAAVCKVELTKRDDPPSLFDSLLNALKDLRLRLFAAAAFLSSVAVSTLLVFQVPTMTWAGASAGTAALLASLRGLMQLAGRIPLLAAINRYTASRLIVIARMLLGISALFLLGSGNIALALIYIVLAGVTIGALSALDGVVAREIVQPEVFGTVMGGIGLVATIGGSLGPIFAGWLRDLFDSPVAPIIIVLFAACSAATIFAIQQSIARTNPATQ